MSSGNVDDGESSRMPCISHKCDASPTKSAESMTKEESRNSSCHSSIVSSAEQESYKTSPYKSPFVFIGKGFNILSFYLYKGYLEGKTLRDISEMDENEFNLFWNSDIKSKMFGCIDEDEDHMLELMKNEYIRPLYKVVQMITKKGEKDEEVETFLEKTGIKFDKASLNTIHIYQKAYVRPYMYIDLCDIVVENCPKEVTSLYYDCPNESNKLMSINDAPPTTFYLEKAGINGSKGIDKSFIERCMYCRWWNEIKGEKADIPVYKQIFYNGMKYMFIGNIEVDKELRIKDVYVNEKKIVKVNCEGKGKIPAEYLKYLSDLVSQIPIDEDFLNTQV